MVSILNIASKKYGQGLHYFTEFYCSNDNNLYDIQLSY